MKELSCGFILKDVNTNKILACLPSNYPKNKPIYDIPKGHIEQGETTYQCAIRELFEETGIKESELSEIKEIGRLPYRPHKKDLHIYVAKCNIDTEKLSCSTSFTDSYGTTLPEVCAYKLVEATDDILNETYYPSLVNIIKFALDL